MDGHYGKYLLGENISKRNGERDKIKKWKISSLGENGFVLYLSFFYMFRSNFVRETESGAGSPAPAPAALPDCSTPSAGT